MNTTDLKENLNPIINNSKQSIKEQVDYFKSKLEACSDREYFGICEKYIDFLKILSNDERKEAGIKITKIYQECIRRCQSQGYHNNERFISLFIEYIKLYELKPLEQFKFMYNHKYGLKMADLYIEWSHVLENNNDLKEAIKILELGLKQECLKSNVRINNHLNKLKPEHKPEAQKAKEQPLPVQKVLVQKFAFDFRLIYPDPETNEEYSFEERRAQVIRSAYAKYEIKEQQYINQINELKLELEREKQKYSHNNMHLEKEDFSKAKKHIKTTHFDSTTLFRSNENNFADCTNFTNVTHSHNQTSFWQASRNPVKTNYGGDDDKMDESDEDEFQSNQERSMLPPPPPIAELSQLNDTNVILTLPGGASNSLMMFNSYNNFDNQSNFSERKRISKMFHPSMRDDTLSTTTNKAAETILIFQDENEDTKDFSIFVDNSLRHSSTAGGVHQQQQQENEKMNKIKKYNEDGSLFVYDANQTEIIQTNKREPLKLISQPPVSETPNFEMTIEQSIMTTTAISFNADDTNTKIEFDPDAASTRFIPKRDTAAVASAPGSNNTSRIDFEPPAASTCFIKPILKSSKPIIISQDVYINNENMNSVDKDIEKEKLLELHLAKSNDMNMTKMISEDCMTQLTKWSSNCTKLNKQSVRFHDDEDNNDRKKETPSSSHQTITSKTIEFEKSRIQGPEISWDNETQMMEATTESSNNNTALDINFSLIPENIKTPETIDLLMKTDEYYETMNNENEPLTSEKLDQTFQNDYHRLYFDNISCVPTPQSPNKTSYTSPNKTSYTSRFKKYSSEVLKADDLIKAFNSNEMMYQMIIAEKSIAERSLANLTQLAPRNVTILEEDIKEEENSLSNNTLCDITTTTATTDVATAVATTTTTTTTSDNNNSKVDNSLPNNNTFIETAAASTTSTTNTTSTTTINTSSKTVKGEDVTFSNTTLSETIFEDNLSNPNETIQLAIKDPFNFDVKIRLLERGPISVLKANNKYKSLCTNAPLIKEKTSCSLNDNESYDVLKEIGKGAYAKIYLIQNKNKKEKKYALKVDRQATAWEFYITEIIHERLASLSSENRMVIDVKKSFVKIEQFMKYNNGCLSAMNHYTNGSLLNLVNYHIKKELTFPYWFVIYLTLEMLNILDYLHKCKILHADIKIDNFLVDQLPHDIDYFEPNKTKCLILIDFNRSIDLELLPNEAQFDAKSENKSLLCCEMKANQKWTYQIDFYGILSSIHCIIFKKYMNVYTEKNLHKISSNFPRNYDKLFHELFDTYLNIPSCQQIPDLRKDWIDKFIVLFKQELGQTFFKSTKYLKDLNSVQLTEFS